MVATTRGQKALHQIKMHNHSSPLLSLPLELQREIWSHLLGGYLIDLHYEHVRPKGRKKVVGRKQLVGRVCRCRTHDQRTSSEDQNCSTEGRPHKGLIATSILLVCKAINVQAQPILWSQNTFSFKSSSDMVMQSFIRGQLYVEGEKNLAAIRSLEFECDETFGSCYQFSDAVELFPKHLPDITTMAINLAVDDLASRDSLDIEPTNEDINSFMEALEEFDVPTLATLPLKKVSFSIQENSGPQDAEKVWAVGKFRVWVEGMKKRLLKGIEK